MVAQGYHLNRQCIQREVRVLYGALLSSIMVMQLTVNQKIAGSSPASAVGQ